MAVGAVAPIPILDAGGTNASAEDEDEYAFLDDLLRPLSKRMVSTLLPYVFLLVGINFFLTVAAVSLVFYVNSRL